MCGIGGMYTFTDEPCPAIDASILWALLASRGSDASGFVVRPFEGTDRYFWFKHNLPSYDQAHVLYQQLSATPARWVMMHTRAQTQGPAVVRANNHPVRFGNIAVVHNGMIWNDDQVFSTLKQKRGKRAVDTAAIAAALHVGGLDAVLEHCKGSMAIAWVNKRWPDELNLYTNGGSPLYVTEDETGLAFASDARFLPLRVQHASGGLVKEGTHIIVHPTGRTVTDVGVGESRTVKPWAQRGGATGNGLRQVDRRWYGMGGSYKCYVDDCFNKIVGHIHVAPYYPLGDHFHESPLARQAGLGFPNTPPATPKGGPLVQVWNKVTKKFENRE